MRSLTLKLTLAFLVVSLAGTALVAVFVWQTTTSEFDRYVQDQERDTFVANAAAYYEMRGSWAGVAEHFRRVTPAPQGIPPRPGNAGPQPPPLQPGNTGGTQPLSVQQENPFALADQNGRVVVPAGRYLAGDRVPAAELERGVAVEVDDQVVGTVLTVGPPPQRTPRDEAYLERTSQVLLITALGATGTALLLGLLLARTLTRPLRELTSATRAMAQGDLEQQVPIRSRDELGELAASFNQMSADLARANDLRRQMTADIAHDLRTPLSVITGYTEALRDGVLHPSPEMFQTMHREAEHLSLLVEDLRTLSLADAGELTLTRSTVHPRELLDRMAAAFGPRADKLGIDLQANAEESVPTIHVDPERMTQVLGNLVSNALRHTPAGGQIALSAARSGGHVLLRVRDTGAGIAPKDLPRIFDRFYRGDEARQTHGGESGLGLAIAKAIVELHGGTIAVESTPGAGTAFTIALPAAG